MPHGDKRTGFGGGEKQAQVLTPSLNLCLEQVASYPQAPLPPPLIFKT